MEKRRVAIVSFFKSESYGAILQCLGLQRILELHGYISGYLDYDRIVKLPFSKKIINKSYQIVRRIFGYSERLRKTNDFIRRYLNVYYFEKETDFSLYIVGSDQVWLPENANDFFLLNFVQSSRKISFASSFGINELPERLYDYYHRSLSSFEAISTRENSGRFILQGMGFNDVRVVLDPTLLLTRQEWMQYMILPKVKKKYILCYVMSGDSVTSRIIYRTAKLLADCKGPDYTVLTIGEKEYKSILPGFNIICNAGPAEFLGYIYQADYIITSSFHGTCFSILFNKNYVNILRPDNPVNCRIEELDNKLHLEKRLYYTDKMSGLPDFSSIDYSYTNLVLQEYRKESVAYLIGAIGKLD